MMSYSISQWILFFFCYAFIGWIWECCFVSMKEFYRNRKWKFVNRGFLHGPFIPIYGFVAISILITTVPIRAQGLNKPHSRLTESGVQLRLREMGKKLGVEKVHPHKFRRTMATRAIEKGMTIEQVQKILGHEQIDTTLRYAMVNQNNVKLSHRKFIS